MKMISSKINSKEYMILKYIIEENDGKMEVNSVFFCQNKEIIKSLGIKGCINIIKNNINENEKNIEIEVDSLGRLEYNLFEKDMKNKMKMREITCWLH